MPTKQRVIVYVDGYNFYYGLKYANWRFFYWLDLVKFFSHFLLPGQQLVAVKYFSARPTDPEKLVRQDAFFLANKENPRFHLILGKYLQKKIECHHCHALMTHFEEKETDVRIATQMVADAYIGNCDVSMLVSADSDMVPAVELLAKSHVRTVVCFPPSVRSKPLADLCEGNIIDLQNHFREFQLSLLPKVVTRKNGDKLRIPKKWEGFQYYY